MVKSPMWFMVVAALALLWNLLGCAAIGMDLGMTPEDVARLPAAQQALHARPAWGVAASVVAVLAGAVGCVGLLLRRRWALPVLLASLAGIIVQDIDLFVVGDALRLGGNAVAVMQGLVFVIGIGLVWLARTATARGWLK